jgi:hypothetical protein
VFFKSDGVLRGALGQIGGPQQISRTAGESLMVDKKTLGQPALIPDPSSTPVDESATSAKRRNPNVKDHIGRQLRALYDEVAGQPVPDRFMELLNRLDEKSGDE